MYNMSSKGEGTFSKSFGFHASLCGCRLFGDGLFVSLQSQPKSKRGDNLFVIFWGIFLQVLSSEGQQFEETSVQQLQL